MHYWTTIGILWLFLILLKPKADKVMVVLGSGGHTTEMLKMIQGSTAERIYVIAETDHSSQHKISDSNQYVKIPRSRHVHQSWFTTLFTTFYSLLYSVLLIFKHHPKVLICNGPGTCVPLAITCVVFRYLFLFKTRVIFIESFARVNDVSLSGKILYPFVDRFLVQWQELKQKYPKAEFYGRLV
jgi:beta-1,4-N-acetylglucosaminyltransferase